MITTGLNQMEHVSDLQWAALGLLLAGVLLTTVIMAFVRGSDDLDD